MGDDNQAYTTNQDGSISIKGDDGKTVKYVRESDLGAVKVQLKDKEGEVSKLQTDLANTTTKYDTEHQEVLKVRASNEELDKGAKEGSAWKTKAEGLETQVADLTKVSGEAATKLTERLMTHLKTTYKVGDDKLKDKALPELEQIESAFILTGVVPAAANYDGKGSGDGSGGDLTGKGPLALARMGYEDSNKK